MSALDVGARGMALRAAQLGEEGLEKGRQRADIRDWIGGSWSADNEYSSEIQAAIDQLDNQNGPINSGPLLHFPTGRIKLANTLNWRQVCAQGASHGTMIEWAGGAQTAIIVNTTFFSLKDIRFYAKDTQRPVTWLDVRGNPAAPVVDFGSQLDNVYFGRASGSALKLASIVNFTMNRPRFDNAARMVEITCNGQGSANRHVLMIGGTIDWSNQQSFGTGGNVKVEELFRLNTGSNAQGGVGSDMLDITWLGGRIEGKVDNWGDEFAILRTCGNFQSGRPVRLNLAHGGFDAQGSPTTQSPSLVRIDSTQTNVAPSISLQAWYNTIITQALGGSVPAFLHNPAVPTGRVLDWLVQAPVAGGEPNSVQFPRDVHFGESAFTNTMVGNSAVGWRVNHPSGSALIAGAGNPEGAVVANKGSLFLRKDGSAAYNIYVKESGTGNTGWVNCSLRQSALAYAAPAVSYAAPSGGSTVDAQARSALGALATDLAAVRTALGQMLAILQDARVKV